MKGTTHVRIDKKLERELRAKFPNVKMPSLLNTMYDTSLLKLESKLRDSKFMRELIKDFNK